MNTPNNQFLAALVRGTGLWAALFALTGAASAQLVWQPSNAPQDTKMGLS
jgi:hypothetical protein